MGFTVEWSSYYDIGSYISLSCFGNSSLSQILFINTSNLRRYMNMEEIHETIYEEGLGV